MAINKVAFTAVGLACITAAGAGGYFALRQNAAPESTPVAATTPVTTTTDAAPVASAPAKSVEETETVVAPAKTAKAPKKTSSPAVVACE